MPVTVIVGGQFGSEGKGKIAHYLAHERCASVAVRVGGSNSGHTVIDSSGTPRIFRVLPTPALLDGVRCVIGAGSYIDVDVLLAEVAIAQLPPERLLIDPNAFVITDAHKGVENQWGLIERIGSTGSGTGAAAVERICRRTERHLARHDLRLSRYTRHSVTDFLRSVLRRGEQVIIEGTQGFGLSLLHSPYYPKATSRDTTAGTFVAEAGVSPRDVSDVVLVLRAFPIRVAGDSGPLAQEIDWAIVGHEGGWREAPIEYTSVTGKMRRVARFDPSIVRQAIEVNYPNSIVLNHADYFDRVAHDSKEPTEAVIRNIAKIEGLIDQQINLIGLGPSSLYPRSDLVSKSGFL
jgi:adenylosuccinate synthase